MISIKKFFTKDISKADETDIEFSLDKGELAKVSKTWYEEEVRKALIDRVKGRVKKKMIEMCYSEDEVKDTYAITKGEGYVYVNDEGKYHEFLSLYPKAVTSGWGNGAAIYELRFNLDKLIDRVVGDFYE